MGRNVFSSTQKGAKPMLMNSDANTSERFWRKQARVAVARFNFALWLGAFLPWAFGSSVAFAAALLVVRGLRADAGMAWMIYGAVLFLCASATLLMARRRFIFSADALTRFDAVLRLHNRLTSAAADVGEWPAAMTRPPSSGFQWRWRAILLPLGTALGLVVAAACIPF